MDGGDFPHGVAVQLLPAGAPHIAASRGSARHEGHESASAVIRGAASARAPRADRSRVSRADGHRRMCSRLRAAMRSGRIAGGDQDGESRAALRGIADRERAPAGGSLDAHAHRAALVRMARGVFHQLAHRVDEQLRVTAEPPRSHTGAPSLGRCKRDRRERRATGIQCLVMGESPLSSHRRAGWRRDRRPLRSDRAGRSG